MIAETTATEKAIDDGPTENPPTPLEGVRVSVERRLRVFTARDRKAGYGEENVLFVAQRDAARTTVEIRPCRDTSLYITLDDLVEVVTTLCPPWLLRKKLGL